MVLSQDAIVSFEANWLFIVQMVEAKLNARCDGLDTVKKNTQTLYTTPFAPRPVHRVLFDAFIVLNCVAILFRITERVCFPFCHKYHLKNLPKKLWEGVLFS